MENLTRVQKVNAIANLFVAGWTLANIPGCDVANDVLAIAQQHMDKCKDQTDICDQIEMHANSSAYLAGIKDFSIYAIPKALAGVVIYQIDSNENSSK